MTTPLSKAELERYAWQMATPDVGAAGQARLKAASVLVSRVGGIGGTTAYYLAAAGVGRLVLAHGGNLRADDLNRQILMSHDAIGQSRVETASRRLRELNPQVIIESIAENASAVNADQLVAAVDVVVDAAPLFAERFALNAAAVRQGKPLIDAAMYEFDAQLTTILPGRTPCLACLYPSEPPAWKRQFPVFGAVAGTIGALAAVEVIKLLTGVGDLLSGRMLIADLRSMAFRTVTLNRRPDCAVCGQVFA